MDPLQRTGVLVDLDETIKRLPADVVVARSIDRGVRDQQRLEVRELAQPA
ncbi:hypothetical protein JOF29_005616 [Kribbella aluminosa]|uniref:Uncharacterized protein n=1 Tax=Kribbella aluminosa TaxID=416017 RepID=A0ABS4USI1_9ACTN|nr:hypothetical protein [Kribbella aluminosa]MBP2354506.1 hypothetical protein [Kribbella aluminosa]